MFAEFSPIFVLLSSLALGEWYFVRLMSPVINLRAVDMSVQLIFLSWIDLDQY